MTRTVTMEVDVNTSVSVEIDADDMLSELTDEELIQEVQTRFDTSDEKTKLLNIYNSIIIGNKEVSIDLMHSYLRDKLERAL